ncbi:hypothetical protein [Ruminococcus flavefaciens]|uniref:hypothetical protein n=1 Tax=Ruminococcus flavefaciens TaxID=1265 RepID=UPI0026EBAC31|nr:hypothetical protein [Ruminococcus flavefaciens]
MGENNEERIVMLTIKEAAALVEGLTEYRVRQMCINDQVPHIMAGKNISSTRTCSSGICVGRLRK